MDYFYFSLPPLQCAVSVPFRRVPFLLLLLLLTTTAAAARRGETIDYPVSTLFAQPASRSSAGHPPRYVGCAFIVLVISDGPRLARVIGIMYVVLVCISIIIIIIMTIIRRKITGVPLCC